MRAANTNPANFVLHEITDSCERLFQRFGIGSNGSGYPFEKNVIRSNGSGYPLEKEMSSLRTTQAIRSRKIVIRLNGSDYPLEKIVISSDGSGYPFERLELSVQNNCQPRYFSKSPSPEPFATKLSKNHVSQIILLRVVYNHLMNFHGTFSAE